MSDAAGPRWAVHRAYVLAVFVLGLAALWDSLDQLRRFDVSYEWIALTLLVLLSQVWKTRPIKVPGVPAHLSASEVLLFIIVLLFGTAPAVVTLAIDGLLFALRREMSRARRRQYLQAAFGVGEPALSTWAASAVYYRIAGVGPLIEAGGSLTQVALPALALGATYYLMNSGLNAAVIGTSTGTSPFRHWTEKYSNLAGIYLGSASIASVVAVGLVATDPAGRLVLVVVIAPLVFAVYQYNRLETDRQNAIDAHMREKDQLTVNMAETLAMMAEETDEATSLGHIRRVRRYSLWLAEAMGITAPDDLQAIGFAGLLHDLGKARIPDYIRRKPDRLTEAELRTMQTHAAVGASLASRIGFKSGVAPIIRHHHENWDGTGYPDRLRAEAIPLGARILQVADCYDALRARRPYRPAWTHEQAMAIVRERSGTMYDPLVVKAFETIEVRVGTEPYDEGDANDAAQIAEPAPSVQGADHASALVPVEIRASGRNALTQLFQHLARIEPQAGVGATCDIVAGYLRRLTPASLVVFFQRDDRSREVVAVHASGYCEDLVRGERMPLGHNVSGWVAANGRAILNADAALDPLEALSAANPGFKSVLSIPLGHAGKIAGVVTLYAIQPKAFREEQRQAIELVSDAIAETLDRAIRSDERSGAAPTAGLDLGPAPGPALYELLTMDRRNGGGGGRTRAALYLENDADAEVMLHAAMATSHAVRISDLIFRPTDDSLVVLMSDADPSAGRLVVERIAAALPAMVPPPAAGGSPLRIGFAWSPRDGEYWVDLVSVARSRLGRPLEEPPSATAAVPVAATQGGQPCKA